MAALQSPALKQKSNHYPPAWEGKVPLKVRVLTNVRSDLPAFIAPPIAVDKGAEHYVYVNVHGAVLAIIGSGRTLGLKPAEFEVIHWHEAKKTPKEGDYLQIRNELSMFKVIKLNMLVKEGGNIAIGELVDTGHGWKIVRKFYSFTMESDLIGYEDLKILEDDE